MENIKTYEELLKENEELKQRNKNQYETLTEHKIIISENINLNRKINKLIEYNQKIYDTSTENERLMAKINLDILRGEDNDKS